MMRLHNALYKGISTLLACSGIAAADCSWQSGFEFPGAGTNTQVWCSTIFNDGTGPALYVGGNFQYIGGIYSPGIAKWNGTQWQPVGNQIFTHTSASSLGIRALTSYDPDGVGPLPAKLIAGGRFTKVGATFANNIAAWDGTTWAALGTASNNGVRGTINSNCEEAVNALISFDPTGSGTSLLYVGGGFRTINGTVTIANGIGTWNGTSWAKISASSNGVNGTSNTLSAFRDGGVQSFAIYNNTLHIGGNFSTINGVTGTANVCRWTGSAIQPLATGVNDTVYAMTVADPDADGPRAQELILGGSIAVTSPVRREIVLAWDGSAFSQLGLVDEVARVRALLTHNGEIYAAGANPYNLALLGQASSVLRWSGTQWLPVGGGTGGYLDTRNSGLLTPELRTLIAANIDNSGTPKLVAGGYHQTTTGGRYAFGIARLDDAEWNPMPAGNGISPSGANFAALDVDGPGPSPATGFLAPLLFTPNLGALSSGYVLVHDGVFSAGPTMSGEAVPASFDVVDLPGFGKSAVAFNPLIGLLVRWNGSGWEELYPLGSDYFLDDSSNPVYTTPAVHDIAVFDPDGAGVLPASVYIAGKFKHLGENGVIDAAGIARWNGTAWEDVGGGVSGASNSGAICLHVHDDGNGPALYAGGEFTSAGGQPAGNIARWDGTSWSSMNGGLGGYPRSMATFDTDGAGPALPTLVIIGYFSTAGDPATPVRSVAAWNGSGWSALGDDQLYRRSFIGNTDAAFVPDLQTLKVFDLDGSGDALYIGGDLGSATDAQVRSIAKLSGNAWVGVGGGIGDDRPNASSSVTSIEGVYEDGQRSLYVTGGFSMAGGIASSGIARYTCDYAAPCPADFNNDNTRDVADLFAYINAWLAKTGSADFNNDNAVDVADLFAYINAWLAGC